MKQQTLLPSLLHGEQEELQFRCQLLLPLCKMQQSSWVHWSLSLAVFSFSLVRQDDSHSSMKCPVTKVPLCSSPSWYHSSFILQTKTLDTVISQDSYSKISPPLAYSWQSLRHLLDSRLELAFTLDADMSSYDVFLAARFQGRNCLLSLKIIRLYINLKF